MTRRATLRRLAGALAAAAVLAALGVLALVADAPGRPPTGALALAGLVLAAAASAAVTVRYRRPLWTGALASGLLAVGLAGVAVGPQVLAVGGLVAAAALALSVAEHLART